jgi:hypothetical protein
MSGSGGWLTNGVQKVQAAVQNTTTTDPVPLTLLPSTALIPADTESTAGQQPQTVAASAFDIAAAAAAFITNSATSTVHTATLNTTSGYMLTEALTTAAGADYTFQLVNSLITATGPIPKVQMKDGTNTAGAARLKSIVNATGTATCVFSNVGTAAFNGTKTILFHI